MDFATLFESKAQQLFWEAVDPAHLSGAPAPRLIEPGQAYFVIRLCEMYLATARKLWSQIYPMMHCYTQYGGTEDHAVVSPLQFKELGDQNLDRIVNAGTHLSGPNPYYGGEVTIMAGLYSVPGHDAAKALIDLLSTFAALNPATLAQVAFFSAILKSGVESILGLDQASLRLGVSDTFDPNSNPLTSGYFIGIGAAEKDIDTSQLWVCGRRLRKGKTAASSVPYDDHDYMLIAIERLESRDDWLQFPGLTSYFQKFDNLTGDTQFSKAEKQSRLAVLWPGFVQALADAPQLIDTDRERIAAIVAAGLLQKLKAQEDGNPFLLKAA